MGAVAVDPGQVGDAAGRVAERVADMIRGLTDTSIRIPHSEWTVGEAAAHLAYTSVGMAIIVRGMEVEHGDGTRKGLAEANAVSLEGFTEREGAVLADRIVEGARVCLAEAAAQPRDRTCRTPMGTMGIDTLTSYLLTHTLMHGCAIATALDKQYPFEAEHVGLIWPFLSHALPLVVDKQAARGLNACLEVRLRGGFGFSMMFDDGELTVASSPSRPVDCYIEADPVAFFLVGVKLISPSEAIERGEITTWGPDPELGLRLPSYFDIP